MAEFPIGFKEPSIPLSITAAKKQMLLEDLADVFTTVYDRYFIKAVQSEGRLFSDYVVRQANGSVDMQKVFTEVLTNFELRARMIDKDKEVVMQKLHKMFYHEFKMTFAMDDAPGKQVFYEGKSVYGVYGQVSLKAFTNKVINTFAVQLNPID